jgi:hypothetical protein
MVTGVSCTDSRRGRRHCPGQDRQVLAPLGTRHQLRLHNLYLAKITASCHCGRGLIGNNANTGLRPACFVIEPHCRRLTGPLTLQTLRLSLSPRLKASIWGLLLWLGLLVSLHFKLYGESLSKRLRNVSSNIYIFTCQHSGHSFFDIIWSRRRRISEVKTI